MMTTTDELRKYELMIILSGELKESDFEKEFGELRSFLQENTKGISYEDNWGKLDFAYRIKKQSRGYYIILNFTAAPEQILELRNTLKLNQNILRHLLISLPDDYEPGHYKEEVLREQKPEEETRRRKFQIPEKQRPIAQEPAIREAPTLAGKEEEEHLKKVEKKLEEILENPDIEIK